MTSNKWESFSLSKQDFTSSKSKMESSKTSYLIAIIIPLNYKSLSINSLTFKVYLENGFLFSEKLPKRTFSVLKTEPSLFTSFSC